MKFKKTTEDTESHCLQTIKLRLKVIQVKGRDSTKSLIVKCKKCL